MGATITAHCRKSAAKDIKDVQKDHKEIGKDIIDAKGGRKEVKEAAKDAKEVGKEAFEWLPGRGGDLMAGDDRMAALETRGAEDQAAGQRDAGRRADPRPPRCQGTPDSSVQEIGALTVVAEGSSRAQAIVADPLGM